MSEYYSSLAAAVRTNVYFGSKRRFGMSAASIARMSEATSGALGRLSPACRCAHAGYLLKPIPVELPPHGRANNLQQSWRFDREPPKAVLRDVWTIDWILGG